MVNFNVLITSLAESVPSLVHATFKTRYFALLVSMRVFDPQDQDWHADGDETPLFLFSQLEMTTNEFWDNKDPIYFQELFFGFRTFSTFLRHSDTSDIQDVMGHVLYRFIVSAISYLSPRAAPEARYLATARLCLSWANAFISDHPSTLCPPFSKQLLEFIQGRNASIKAVPPALLRDTVHQLWEVIQRDQICTLMPLQSLKTFFGSPTYSEKKGVLERSGEGRFSWEETGVSE
ncbi:hypothetical protein NLI96_g8504 [Meripilus lineatus]|uniref:Uncharacterized protein n=1 Tax=Meripilus lineatus TaxID=2056292 RepID=A0AAD5UYT9_9APHY|nr:hypothetical protein NLI96_g8504 [Physisporinus lineatus]